MPTVKETTVYKFSELSETAKQKAIESFWDLNVDYDWWEFTYEDAATIGLKITGFDLGRGRDITGELTESIASSIESILENHGEDCDTYKLATSFKERLTVIQVADKLTDNESEDELNELTEKYEKELLNCYWKMLATEYNYKTSEEAVIESIEANEYDFEKDGTQF